MKLQKKLLLSSLTILVVLGAVSTFLLLYILDHNKTDLSLYRQREVATLVAILNAAIVEKDRLKSIPYIQSLFDKVAKELPHIKRLTLHTKDPKTGEYHRVVCTIHRTIGAPSDPEDIAAIERKAVTILYEKGQNGEKLIDFTYPIVNSKEQALASIGVLLALDKYDSILNRSILQSVHQKVYYTVIITLLLALLAALSFGIYTSRVITTPILRLKNAVKSFTPQKFQPLEVTTKDEIAELIEAYNAMGRELQLLHASMKEQIAQAKKELQQQYLHDPLTGLPNRKALMEEMEKLEHFHIAILDIAAFKDLNDYYGIEIGNEVLKKIARLLEFHLVQSSLLLYRIGADEFVVINPRLLSKEHFVKELKNTIDLLEHEVFYFDEDSIEVNVSLHCGISFHTEHPLEFANIALIKAKKMQQDIAIFEPEDYNESLHQQRLDTIKKIKHAVETYGFIACYQPIFDRKGDIVKYETLVRMKDGNKLLNPYHFLDIAKKTKFYHHITRSMIAQAFRAIQQRAAAFSINLEAEDILNDSTLLFIKEQLLLCKEPHKIVFELVESEDMYKIEKIREFLEFVKASGAQLAIDDFGTGYSNFAYIMDIAPQIIKIDGSLIKNIDTDEKSYNIVRTIVHLAHEMNIMVVAEFVHSKSVYDVCMGLGVDEFQGFYLAEPSIDFLQNS